jgi:translation initiation factor IF-1
MDFYLFALILGFAGLLVMAFTGVAGAHGHAGHAGHAGGHGHALPGQGHAGGHALHAGPAHGHAAHGHTHAHEGGQQHGGDAKSAAGTFLMSFMSPRVAFSILVGLGASGLLLSELVPEPLLAVLAVAGGLVFELAAVRPVWNLLFRFASTPAITLEGALLESARAETGFDTNGQGLVSLELDGQVVQLLGTLRPEDRQAGVRVRAGDALLVENVDGQRNRCTVSWAGAAEGADARQPSFNPPSSATGANR